MRISDWSSDVCSSDLRFIHAALTPANYRELLTPLLTDGEGQGFCVNLSIDVSSLDVMKLCRELGTLYIDTVVEPWLGFYFDVGADPAKRTNYALRESVRREKARNPGGPTAVSCCGAHRSEAHTSGLQSLMRRSYAVFCLKK